MRINEIKIDGEVYWAGDTDVTGGQSMWLDGDVEVELESHHVVLQFFANNEFQRVKIPVQDLIELAALAQKHR